MIEVYINSNTDFGSNGDMTLTPSSCEVELTVEGVAELTLIHTIDDLGRWEYLENDNVIAAPTPYSEKQLFRIYDRVKNDDEITAYARHVFLDSSGEMLIDVRPTDKTGQEALDTVLTGTKYKAKTNIEKRTTAYYIRKNIMEAIAGEDENSFINRWGGERMYDNYTIIINDRLGGDYGACAEFGYNAQGIEEDVNIDDVVTRIIPVAYNGITLEGAEPWVDSPLIGKYANVRAAVIKFEDVKLLEDCQEGEEGFSTKALLQQELIRRCEKEFENGLDKPTVNYNVDMLELASLDEYKDYKILETIGLGDDVRTRNRKIKVDVMARCIRLVYDCLERKNNEVELGNFKENYFDKTTSAADIIHRVTREDGTLKAEDIYGTIDAVKAQLKAQRDISQPSEIRAILFEDMVEDSPTYGAMSIGTMGFCIASERTADGKDWDWKTFGTGSGFYADYVCFGEIDGALVRANSIQAEAISIEYKQSVEDHLSEAIKESERTYKNTIDELVSGFSESYATFGYVDETAAELAAEAENNANTATDDKLKKYATIVNMETQISQTAEAIKTEAAKTYATFGYANLIGTAAENAANAATDEKLKNYATTIDMNTAITQTADNIKLEASMSYATFNYVDDTAGSLADEAESNANAYADEAAAAAENAANAATDEKLKNYTTTINMNTAIDQAAEEVKILAKKEVDSVKHNYVVNGSFANLDTEGWKTNSANNVAAKTVEGLGTLVELAKPSATSVYIYQYWKLKAGTYKVRFKAAAAEGVESTARVRVTLGGVGYITATGKLKSTELTQFETEITLTTDATRYLYVYPYVTGKTVYVTDIEVLGKYEDYAEANFSVMSDSITAEVTRATGIEEELRAAIQVNADNITGKVAVGEFASYVTQYYDRVITAFNNSSKYVQITAGEIGIYDNGITDSKKRAVFDENGNHFWRDNYYVGAIGTNQWSDNTAHKGLVFDLEYTGKYMAWAQKASSAATTYNTILCYSRANSIYDEAGLHIGCNVYGHNWDLYDVDLHSTLADGYTTFTGSIPIVTKIQDLGDGAIQWNYSTITVRNGLITAAPTS